MIEFDVETVGLQWYAPSFRVFMAQFWEDGGEPVVLRHPEDFEQIQAWLRKDDDYRAWNSKFDLKALAAEGYELPPPERLHDGMVAAKLLDERPSAKLEDVGSRLLGIDTHELKRGVQGWLKEEDKRRRKESKETGKQFIPANYGDVPDEIITPYALNDVILTKQIGSIQYPAIQQDPELAALYELEMEVMDALFQAELRGLPVDHEDLRHLEASLKVGLDAMEAQARELAGKDNFNPRSSKQLYEALKRRGADLQFVTGESMDEENLSTVHDELAELVLAYRGEKKMLGTYVEPMLHGKYSTSLRAWREPFIGSDGRIHGNFNQVGARTGRMSSSDPNLQNLPRDDLRLRYAIVADPGYKLVAVDLDNIELVLFAGFAGDGRLKQQIIDGVDSHAETARFIDLKDYVRPGGHIESARQRGKTFNYSMVYGAGVRSVRKKYKVPEPKAKAMINKYMEAYPEVLRLRRVIEYKLRERGYVKDPWGRRFHGTPRDAYKMTNYLVQGTAAELLKVAAVKVHKAGVPLVGFIHDELLAHVPAADAEEAAQLMQAALTDHPRITEPTGLPIKAEAQIVDRWSQAKKPDYVPDYAIEQRRAA